jgi:signal transduction histidine kinase
VFDRLRWWTILIPALVVGAIELVSDSFLDEYLSFPWDTLIVVAAVGALWLVYWRLAIERVHVLGTALQQRNAELEQRNATSRALHHVSVAITALADLDEVVQAVVDQARTLLAADVALLLLTGADGEVGLRAWSGAPGVVDATGSGPGPDALRFVSGDVARVQLAAPLQRGGQTIGLLFVGCRLARGFDVDDVETLSSLANQAAIALENARLQGRLRELAVVAERERIAREMHDGLAQVLGYVNTKSQAVETLLEAGRTADARSHLAELSAAARSVYVDVREAILGLRSPIRPEVGLVGAIEEYARRFADASKLAVAVDASPAARTAELSPDVEAQVFRIVQEVLTNVRKHAGARRATLTLAIEHGGLVLTVADDGRGIAPAADTLGDWPHYGLVAIRERAGSIGATVAWTLEEPGGGTRVRLDVPLGALVAPQPVAGTR